MQQEQHRLFVERCPVAEEYVVDGGTVMMPRRFTKRRITLAPSEFQRTSASYGVVENASTSRVSDYVLVFGESKGLYGGVVVKGGSVAGDDKANEKYQGQWYSAKDILFDVKVKPSETAAEFDRKLGEAAKRQVGRQLHCSPVAWAVRPARDQC